MSINGINGSSRAYYDYSSTINQLKLDQALAKTDTSYTDKKYENIANGSLKESQAFIKNYNTAMSDLLQSANALKAGNTSGVLNQTSAVSSDSKVATASKNYSWDRSSDTYNLEVKQLAAAQTNTSAAVKSSDAAAGNAVFTLTTKTGAKNFNVSATDANGQPKTNKQLFSDIAKQINGSKNLGVSATVVEQDGKTSLKLTGAKTGEENAFTLQGDFADTAGLDNVTTAAKDAIYSVQVNDGTAKDYTSASNDITVGNGKVNVTLKDEGSAKISMGLNTDKVTAAVEDLVKNYNSALKVLNDNADRGTGVTRQLKNMLTGPASEQKLELMGISTKKDGTLVLDKDKLAESLEKDPNMAKNILGGSNGVAQGVFNDARSGLTMNSSSLINNDVKQSQKAAANDPLQIMSMFSRSGSFNLMNYNTVGMMFNMLI